MNDNVSHNVSLYLRLLLSNNIKASLTDDVEDVISLINVRQDIFIINDKFQIFSA